MNNTPEATNDSAAQWQNHVFQAAKSFLQSAVVIDDRPFRSRWHADTNSSPASNDVERERPEAPSEIPGPLPTSPKTAKMSASKASLEPANDTTRTQEHSEEKEEQAVSKLSSSSHDLNLKVLTDSFASHGIICGTLIPDSSDFGPSTTGGPQSDLIDRAKKMAQAADILILDWFLKENNSETTLEIIQTVLLSDQQQNGRTRLICIYTGEEGLEAIRQQVCDRFPESSFNLEDSNYSIRLRNESTVIVFFNKDGVEGEFSVDESQLAARVILEFAQLIDGILPSFAASSIGAIRGNTHGILDVFRAELDPAYVGNRAISDPSEEVAELVRELLVSEFDNQIGLAACADKYLAVEAVSLWLQGPGRIRRNCQITVSVQGNPNTSKQVTIDQELISRAASGEIASLDNPFLLENEKVIIREKHRHLLTQSLCESIDSAEETEIKFARLAANKREVFGRRVPDDGWRPSLTLGTILQTIRGPKKEFYLCLTRACDMVRINAAEKSVVLLRIEESTGRFNLVIPKSSIDTAKLLVPRQFADMRSISFKVNPQKRRILARKINRRQRETSFYFAVASGKVRYWYLGELRYVRVLRDVDLLTKKSTAIGIGESEWLRLRERVK